MADPRVLEVQLWVNTTYEGKYGFNSAPENGKTGWSTVYALTRALQIELGISQPADNFGQGTSRAYRNYGELELGNAPTDNKGKRIVKIFQGACYCKGYDPGSFDGVFTEVTQQAVIDLQTDAGLPIRDGKVYDYIFKAFLVMDAYRLTGNGDTKIQSIQRDLNYHYYQTAGVCPCDGHYQRNTNKALIYGIQTEEGIAPELQTGTVGPSTRALLPTLSVGSSGTFVKLFQYALYFNGYDVGAFDGVYGNSTKQTVMNFQEFTALTVDGIAGKQTWLSALISTGDPTRRGTACDCITEITPARAQTLVDEGYETVGRYLVNVEGGLNKKIQPGELATIFNAGLTVFPIFQTIGDSASYFTYNQGKSDAEAAYDAARKYGFHYNTTIYFAVDFDAYGYQITDNVVPYFQGINATMHSLGGFYQIGVYGPRSVGITVSDQGLATTSFVSGMSTGFSGNLGYPLPDNWAFDQISTISIGSGVGYINIDNNIKSGRDEGASSVSPADYDESINNLFFDQIDAIYDIALNHSGNDQADANKLLCHYLRHKNYNGFLWATTAGILDSEFIDKVNDQLNSPEIINPFDVTFETRLDTPHFAATLNSILFIWGSNSFISDFAGWGGDLLTVAGDSVEASNYDTVYDAAYDLIGHRNPSVSTFNLKDLIVDIDAVNIGVQLLNNTEPLNQLIRNYYGYLGDYNWRFTKFLQSRFFMNNEEQSYDYLQDQATAILNSNDLLVAQARALFKDAFDVAYYTEEEGEEVARAFRDVIEREGAKE